MNNYSISDHTGRLAGLVKNPNYLLLLGLFSCAVMMNNVGILKVKPFDFLLLIVMCACLFANIRWWWAAMVIIAINTVHYTFRFPRAPNHCNLEYFASLLILAFLVYKWLKPGLRVHPGTVSLLFRITTITIYFYTGFHKLNTAFFDSRVSCANYINQSAINGILDVTIDFPVWITVALQYLTIIFEMVLPFGLLFMRSRKWTALILLSFHFYLSFQSFAHFGAFATFMTVGCLIDFTNTEQNKKLVSAFRIYVAMMFVSILVVYVMKPLQLHKAVINLFHGIAYNIGFLIFFYIFFKNYRAVPLRYDNRSIVVAALSVTALSCWSLKAYVGLGNSGNLTMFSNLVTEASRSNHYLIDTRKTKLFDFEEDNVLVVQIDDRLNMDYMEGFRVPVTEFAYLTKQMIRKFPDTELQCTLVYKADTITIADLDKSEYAQPAWWYKYLYFRKIQDSGENNCYW